MRKMKRALGAIALTLVAAGQLSAQTQPAAPEPTTSATTPANLRVFQLCS